MNPGMFNLVATFRHFCHQLVPLLFLLVLIEPPVIQPQPSELDVIVNNPILLPCEATGTPSPFITWQKEGINVITAGTYHCFYQENYSKSVFYNSEVSMLFLMKKNLTKILPTVLS